MKRNYDQSDKHEELKGSEHSDDSVIMVSPTGNKKKSNYISSKDRVDTDDAKQPVLK